MIYSFYLFNRDGIFLYSEDWNRCVCCFHARARFVALPGNPILFLQCTGPNRNLIGAKSRSFSSVWCLSSFPRFPPRAHAWLRSGLLFSLKGFAEKLSNKDGCAMHSYKTGYICLIIRCLRFSLPDIGLTSCTFLTR